MAPPAVATNCDATHLLDLAMRTREYQTAKTSVKTDTTVRKIRKGEVIDRAEPKKI